MKNLSWRTDLFREEARARIEALGEPFKLEILENLQEPITIYHTGEEWWDLCAGPHVEKTGKRYQLFLILHLCTLDRMYECEQLI